MWKIIIIRLNACRVIDDNEANCRFDLRTAMENPNVMFAFLYSDKHELTETYINTIKR